VVKILVSEAAKKMGLSTQTLRVALQNNVFPFGKAILTSPNRYTYYINEERFNKYLKGDDMHEKVENYNVVNNCSIAE